MAEETTGFGILPDPEKINPVTREMTPSAAAAQNRELNTERKAAVDEFIASPAGLVLSTGFGVAAKPIFEVAGQVPAAFQSGSNGLYNLYDAAAGVYNDFSNAPVDGYDPKNMPELYHGIPSQYHAAIAATDNPAEAQNIRARVLDHQQNQDRLAASGWVGATAQLAAGLFDADTLLVPITGGGILSEKLAVTLAKTGLKGGRVTGAAIGAVSGLESAAIVGAAGSGSLTANNEDITSTLLMGMGFGATMGTAFGKNSLSPYKEVELARKARDEYKAHLASGNNPYAAGSPIIKSGSLGAAQVGRYPVPQGMSSTSMPWFERANGDINANNARDTLIGKSESESTNTENFIGRSAEKVQNWVDKSPLKSLYTETSNLGVIGNKLAYDLLYHPGGMIDNVPAAGYDYMYNQELSAPVQNYNKLAMQFSNRSNATIQDRVKNAFVGQQAFRDFDRAVMWELETRYHNNGKGDANAHPAVKEYADLYDSMTARAQEILKGRAGETPVAGSEELTNKPGYFRRRWSGEEMAKYNEKDLIDALTTAHMQLFPPNSLDRNIVKKIVKSIITRAKALDEGIDTNLIGLLRQEGKQFLRETLENNNLSDKEIDSILGALTGKADERAKPGYLKDRIELDMRVKIPGTNKSLIDLMQPDFHKTTHQYMRQVSGTAALARKGYQQGDLPGIRAAIKEEIVANGFTGSDPKIDDILDTTLSYFGSGPVGKGVDPMLLSAMRLTRQSMLGTLGLTQMGELGTVVAMSGVEATVKHLPSELRALTSGKMSPFVQELHDAFIFLDKDHQLFDDRLALDLASKSSVAQSNFVQGAHKMLAFGDKIHGYTSLFYQAMSFSQRLALAAGNERIYKVIAGGLDSTKIRQLKGMGLTDDSIAVLEKNIANGNVKEVDGLLTLGLQSWDLADLQTYKLAMNAMAARAVQKDLPGESPSWAHDQWARVLLQFRTFPIQAFQKNFLKNLRQADNTTVAAMTYNLGVAAIVYSVSETVKGRGDQLDMEKIAKGAINYAPTTGWLPMVSDPIAEVLGMPQYRMNQYGPPGRATDGILPTPPVIPALNRIGHIPGALIGLSDGEVDKNEASALSSIPIVGSTYGFSALFNHLKSN